MLHGFPLDQKQLRAFNIERYKGIPPDWNLIVAVLKKSKLKRMSTFESVHKIPQRTLTKYKNGHWSLSPAYWHIFYDYELVNQIYAKPKKNNKFTPNNVPSFVLNQQKIKTIYGSK